jgi:hypothetical protein
MVDRSRLDEFTQGYLNAALFTSHDDRDEPKGEFLADSFNFEDFADKTMEAIIADCKKFQTDNAELLNDDNCPNYCDSLESQAGHDFWLTRCGHGAGFWDGDWINDSGDTLTKSAHSFKEMELYVGDDDLIYALGCE